MNIENVNKISQMLHHVMLLYKICTATKWLADSFRQTPHYLVVNKSINVT
jgi:hypothetical protein